MNPIYKFWITAGDRYFNIYPLIEKGYYSWIGGEFTADANYRSIIIPLVSGEYRILLNNSIETGFVHVLMKNRVGGSIGGGNGMPTDLKGANFMALNFYVGSIPQPGSGYKQYTEQEVNQMFISGVVPYSVSPTYKDDLSKDLELETNQRFYRPKLSGKISFIRNDYDIINNAYFATTFNFLIERSEDGGVTWVNEFKGKFMKTDCTFNNDNKKCVVQPEVLDEYNDVLAGLEKEYNLIAITPEIERIQIKKRPLIQVYLPGDSVVSCFLGGTFWEQDAEETTDRRRLVRDYHFALCNMLKEMKITINGTPTSPNGTYAGRMTFDKNGAYSGKLWSDFDNGYYVYVETRIDTQNWWNWGSVLTEVRQRSDDKALFKYENSTPGDNGFDNMDFELSAVANSGATGKATAEMATYRVYARYLLDVEKIQGLNTYTLPSEDITDYNRNYRRAIGYAIDIAFISNNYSRVPTEWGRADNGQYFAPPYSIWGQKFYPIARSTWRYTSIWFSFHSMDDYMEREGRKTYTLRDSFPVGSCINRLLQQFAPNIKHEETEEYSQFLYGSRNPISYQNFRLFVTQKSNILAGDYQQPAQKAPTTLQQFLNMLRDCFRCYWYIEDGKFKIEHISWFRNGGSYSNNQVVGTDLTKLENIRNAKKWGFSTSEWSFDKIDMAERYQFEWMDDVTQAFEGLPIEVLSNYVTKGKIEEINVSNFTSDVDLMMLNPGSMSKDGFGLFAAVKPDAMDFDAMDIYPGVKSTYGANGLTEPKFTLRPEYKGMNAILRFNPRSSTNAATGQIVFYNGTNVISTQGSFVADGIEKNVSVSIPENATDIGLIVSGSVEVSAYMYKLEVPDKYELPFIERGVEGVKYYLQNGYLAFITLQPNFWIYDLPAKEVLINGGYAHVQGIERKKKQILNFPISGNPNPMQLVKTYIGNGEIDKMSINLCSRMTKTTLKYDTE